MTNTELRELAVAMSEAVPGQVMPARMVDVFTYAEDVAEYGRLILKLIEENEKLRKSNRSLPLAILQCPKCLIPINRRNGEVFL